MSYLCALTRILCGGALLFASTVPMSAASFSFTGSFSADDDLHLVNFSINAPGGAALTIRSFGYAGGLNSAGANIASGGFATNFTVFPIDGSSIVGQDQTGSCLNTPADGSTGLCLDAFIAGFYAPGDYFLALTQQGNFANGPTFADGFSQTGNPNFTGGPFLDPFFNQRNSAWALDIVGADLASSGSDIPEPGSAILVLSSSILLIFARRRRTRRS